MNLYKLTWKNGEESILFSDEDNLYSSIDRVGDPDEVLVDEIPMHHAEGIMITYNHEKEDLYIESSHDLHGEVFEFREGE